MASSDSEESVSSSSTESNQSDTPANKRATLKPVSKLKSTISSPRKVDFGSNTSPSLFKLDITTSTALKEARQDHQHDQATETKQQLASLRQMFAETQEVIEKLRSDLQKQTMITEVAKKNLKDAEEGVENERKAHLAQIKTYQEKLAATTEAKENSHEEAMNRIAAQIVHDAIQRTRQDSSLLSEAYEAVVESVRAKIGVALQLYNANTQPAMEQDDVARGQEDEISCADKHGTDIVCQDCLMDHVSGRI